MTNQIKVEFSAPEGLPKGHVCVFYHPQTVTEFEAIIEAAGGADEFTVTDASLERHSETHDLYVYVPYEERRQIGRSVDPFLAQYMARHSTPDAQERTEEMT
jgi:hypothetical protein